MADVFMQLSADERAAVAAILKVVDAQNKSTSAMRESVKAAKEAEKAQIEAAKRAAEVEKQVMEEEKKWAKEVADEKIAQAKRAAEAAEQAAKEEEAARAEGAKRFGATWQEFAGRGEVALARTEKRSLELGSVAMPALATAVGAVTAGLASLSAAGNSAMDKLAEKSEKFRSNINDLAGALAGMGEANLLPSVREGLAGIGSQTFDQNQLGQMYAKASKAAKGALSSEELLGIVSETDKAGAAHMDTDAFLNTSVRLAGGIMKGKSKEEISDASAAIMKVLPGGLDDQYEKFLGRAQTEKMDPQQAIQLVMAAAKSEEGPKSLNTLLEQATKERLDPKAKARISDLEGQRERDETRLREIQDEKTAAEKDDLSALSAPKRKRAEAKRKEVVQKLDEETRALTRRREDSAKEIAVLKEQKIDGPGLGAILEDPSQLDEMGKVAFRNIRANYDETDAGGGEFGQRQQSWRATVNADPKLRLMARKRAIEVAAENRKINPSTGQLAADVEQMEVDEAGKKSTGFKRLIYEVGKYVDRGMRGAEDYSKNSGVGARGLDSETQAAIAREHLEASKRIEKNTQRPARTEPARNGGY